MQDAFEGSAGFSLADQRTRDAALLRATTELFVQQTAHDHDEIRRYEELALYLLPRMSEPERAFVAERLATRIDAPVAVMRLLARDTIAIAGEVLPKTPVLSTIDLLAVVAATGPAHHRLIAMRPGLSDEVLRALRIAGERTAIATPDAHDPPPQPARRSLGEGGGTVGDHPGRSPFTNARSRLYGFDPWSFLDLDRPARLRLMAQLAGRPPVRRYAGSADRVDRAFRAILTAAQIVSHARSGRRSQLIPTIADATGVETSFVVASLADRTGEALAILLKAIGLDNVQGQQVFLLATATIGRDVNAFFRLSDLYAGMEPVVAETLVSIWRGDRPAISRHQPVLADNSEIRRHAVDEPARVRPVPSDERARRA